MLGLILVWVSACQGNTEAPMRENTTPQAMENRKMSDVPIVSAAKQLNAHDNATVMVVGIYRRALSDVGKRGGEQEVDRGHAAVELEGKRSDYRPSAWDGEPPSVQLTLEAREATEREAFTDKRVRVKGRLVVDPTRLAADPEAARADEEPALFDVESVTLVD